MLQPEDTAAEVECFPLQFLRVCEVALPVQVQYQIVH
jgi:hypothetical protein